MIEQKGRQGTSWNASVRLRLITKIHVYGCFCFSYKYSTSNDTIITCYALCILCKRDL